MVTQVDGTNESEASNEDCATPTMPGYAPSPTDLAISSSGFEVSLSWTRPELDNTEALFLGNPSRNRQGGDNIENATVITELDQLSGTTIGFEDNYDEVCPYVGSGATDVVYSFTPATDIAVDMTTCYSSFDTKLYVYENVAGNLASTTSGGDACSDDDYPDGVDDCTAWTSTIYGVVMEAGNTYYLVIDGYGSDQGDYLVDITINDPLVGYTVYKQESNGNLNPIGQAGANDIDWRTLLFVAEPTDVSLALSANYLLSLIHI